MIIYKTRNQLKFKIYVKPTAKHYLIVSQNITNLTKRVLHCTQILRSTIAKDQTKISTIKGIICFFKLGLMIAIKNASIFLCVLVFDGALLKE